MNWLVAKSVEVTVTGPPQFSEMVPPWAMKLAESVAAGGVGEPFGTVTLGGQVIVGGVVSLTVMVWLHI